MQKVGVGPVQQWKVNVSSTNLVYFHADDKSGSVAGATEFKL